MPEFRLREDTDTRRTMLCNVRPFEVWMDEDGDAVWHDGRGETLYAAKGNGLVMRYRSGAPEGITVVEKLSDPINIRW